MAAQIVTVVEAYKSTVYDGTNGADVVAAIPGAALVSDDGTELKFSIAWSMGTNHYTVLAAQRILWRVLWGSTEIYGTYDAAEFGERYAALPS